MGEVAWVGRGSLGRDDGRIALVPARVARCCDLPDRVDGADRPPVPATRRFARTSPGGAPRSTGSCSLPPAAARTATSSMRSGTSSGPARSRTTRSPRCGRSAGSGPARDARRRPGRLTVPRSARGGRPLVARRAGESDEGTEPQPRARPRRSGSTRSALALLDRHGVVTREAVVDRGRRGRVLGGLPDPAGARGGRPDPARLLRRRAGGRPVRAGRSARAAARVPRTGALARRSASVHLLAAADPANPYGAAIPWPRRGEDDRRPLQRAAGAYVVLVDGVAVLYLERGGGTIQTLPAADDADVADAAVRALGALVADRRVRELIITKVDGGPGRRIAVPRAARRGRVQSRLSRAHPSAARARRAARCPRATRSSELPPGSGRTWSAGP